MSSTRKYLDIVIDDSKDQNLTQFGKETLKDRYLYKNETYQEMFARIAKTFSDNNDHAQRLYDYISNLWFMPATPILSNGGTDRGMPISCLTGDTRIHANKSVVKIENIKVGDEVLTHKGRWKKVIAKREQDSSDLYDLSVTKDFTNTFSYTITGNHPVLTNKGWLRIDTIYELMNNGNTINIAYHEISETNDEEFTWLRDNDCNTIHGYAEISLVQINGGVFKVYDIQVEEDESFTLADSHVIVHNCFLNSVDDQLDGIWDIYRENMKLAAMGGGIGTYWGEVRSIGEEVGRAGKTSGIIPFIKAMDSQTLAVSQGSLRRGSAAVYIDISHPEIEEFLYIRKPSGGDINRKCLNIHHGICIPNSFMEAVKNDELWELKSPKTQQVISKVSARTLWSKILEIRMETGEPYLLFIDHVNDNIPEWHKKDELYVDTSNLCLTGDTKIVTNNGIKTLLELYQTQEEFSVTSDNRTVNDGIGVSSHKSSKVFLTRKNAEVYTVLTEHGYSLKGTADHKLLTEKGWKTIKSLTQDDVLLIQSGEGLWNNSKSSRKDGYDLGTKIFNDSKYYNLGIENREFILGFLEAVFKYNSKKIGEISISLPKITHIQIVKTIQILLSNFGIVSRIYFNGDLKLAIHEKHIDKLNVLFNNEVIVEKNDVFKSSVVSIEYYNKQDVYDITVEGSHSFIANGIVSHNCSEITLPTSSERTAVCCLSSLNIEKYDEWKNNEVFVIDIMRFLDNVLQNFIDSVKGNKNLKELNKAAFSAEQERSVGLGVMGFHSYLQNHMISLESEQAKDVNLEIFKFIKECVDKASKILAKEKGACPDAKKHGYTERFSNKTAIAPTASISIICGGTSPCIEPIAANAYTHKTLSGSFLVKNRALEIILTKYNKNTDETWNSIIANDGSVQHLDFLNDDEKNVFKTAYEIDQNWIIEHAADRASYIDQAASNNLFFNADVDKSYILKSHWDAWKKGVKSLYYCRSRSLKSAHAVSQKVERNKIEDDSDFKQEEIVNENNYFSCESCS